MGDQSDLIAAAHQPPHSRPLLGFTVPPLSYFAFLVAATPTYLLLVEIVKRAVIRYRAAAVGERS